MTTIGFVGLGAMGSRIAVRLNSADHTVTGPSGPRPGPPPAAACMACASPREWLRRATSFSAW